MKHLKLFKTKEEYEAFKESGEYLTPNVSFIETAGSVINDSYQVPTSGDNSKRYFDISSLPSELKNEALTLASYIKQEMNSVYVVAPLYFVDHQFSLNVEKIRAIYCDTAMPIMDGEIIMGIDEVIPTLISSGAIEITREEFYNLESYPTIEFTIDGTSYQAEEGMTWGEFVESKYSNEDFYADTNEGNNWVKYQGYRFKSSTNEWQYADSVIIANEAYHTIQEE